MSIKEMDGLLSLLSEKKRKMEQEEAETNMQLMLSFLHCLRKQKLEELNEVLKFELYICVCVILIMSCMFVKLMIARFLIKSLHNLSLWRYVLAKSLEA